jgi:hypothetical protein
MSRPDESVAGGVRAKLDRLDSYQQRHPALGVPIAVARKFLDDESINLAAVIAFWAFFSVFPLLLFLSPCSVTSCRPTCKVMYCAARPGFSRC